MNDLIKDFTGNDITTIDEEIYIPIIENILYKNDFSMIVGMQKTNKSILSMQMACCISSGTPFLGAFDVPVPKVVWYFGTEGKVNEIKDRFVRMSKIIPTDFNNIVLFSSTQFKFNNGSARKLLEQILFKYKHMLPSVIFVDSLYSSYNGKLTEDDSWNDFVTVLRGFMEVCGDASCVLAHHMTKERRNEKGEIIPQNDSNTYGSTFILGSLDHCFTIEKCKKEEKDRIIKCTTQRSGNIVEHMRVRFYEPEPLYLALISNHVEEEKKVMTLLSTNAYEDGLSHGELLKRTKITKSLFNMVIGEMVTRKKILKTGGRKGLYILNTGKGENIPPLD